MITVLHPVLHHSAVSAVLVGPALFLTAIDKKFFFKITQPEFKAEQMTDTSFEGNIHQTVSLLIGQRIALCMYTCSKQEGRCLFKRSLLMDTNALWWCKKRNPTCGQGFSLWICQNQSQHIGLHFCEDPQGRDFTNCSFYHIRVSNTMLAALELTSYGTNCIHKSFASNMTSLELQSTFTDLLF